MKIIVLAAGYATRLYPITKDKPKALLTVGDRTILDHLIDKVRLLPGREEVIVVTNSRFFGMFDAWAKAQKSRVPVRVVDDGTTSNENRLGAIGDLSLALREGKVDDDVLVLASDNLFEEKLDGFVHFAEKKGGAVSIGVYDIKDPSIAAGRYGVVDFDKAKRVKEIEEKPVRPRTSFVSMGVYYFSRQTLPKMADYLADSKKQDAPGHYIIWLLSHLPVYAYPFHGRWFDIGSVDQLEEASREYKKNA